MDRADFQQQMDLEQREAEALQALMDISAAGFTPQAETLARECGLWDRWSAPVILKREFAERQDGLPF